MSHFLRLHGVFSVSHLRSHLCNNTVIVASWQSWVKECGPGYSGQLTSTMRAMALPHQLESQKNKGEDSVLPFLFVFLWAVAKGSMRVWYSLSVESETAFKDAQWVCFNTLCTRASASICRLRTVTWFYILGDLSRISVTSFPRQMGCEYHS